MNTLIYCDKIGHLVSDTSLPELHEFAQNIGLKREWFQDKSLPHYDLLGTRMNKRAVTAGAKLVDARTLVRVMVRK